MLIIYTGHLVLNIFSNEFNYHEIKKVKKKVSSHIIFIYNHLETLFKKIKIILLNLCLII